MSVMIIIINNDNNYDVDCVFGRNNARSDWLILGHCSFVMPMCRMWACRNKKPDQKQALSVRGKISNLRLVVFTERSV